LSDAKVAKLALRRARQGKEPLEGVLPIVAKRSPLCRRLRMLVRFRGTDFHGWMRQPGLRTVQGELEDTLRRLLGQLVRVVPAGRTDAGVHAMAQVCQFEALLGDLPAADLAAIANVELPEDLRVLSVAVADADFNVMVTKWKRYVYRVPGASPPSSLAKSEPKWPPDVAKMRAAAARLLGEHDFAGFQSKGGRQTTVRTVHRCSVLEAAGGLEVVMEGNGFLMHMCRILVGTLLEVGCGVRSAEHVESILASGDRQLAGPTMSADGLCLEHVEHEQEWSAELSEAIQVSGPVPKSGPVV